MERYVCLHGHFYQPPRENPWLESVEMQDSAYPYHDWNERITAECYAPNATARILDGQDHIVDIVNNYAKISFNFGPTLLSWMKVSAPDTYAAILQADRESQERFSGHGSAMAQAYNHMILPLANERDRRTQVRWGIRDFQYRFARAPEGMWLPETAADVPTLEALAAEGIRFTLLAPSQAARVRKIGAREWTDASGGRIDPTRAYRAALPSGRSIALFFYDGPISRAVAFERLLDRGEYLAGRLLSAYAEGRDWPQLVHIATDGETYGHHHAYGEMALAYALHHIEKNEVARLTNYGEFLERHPPTHEVEIAENTAWSCVHGLGRWTRDCGCKTGGRPGWNQRWREPLRAALDSLRDALAPPYQEEGARLLKDPWAARDEYVDVILDRAPERRQAFLDRHAARPLSSKQAVRVWKLLEMQRQAQLMYTSCGWFFDELSGIETVQVIHYAGAAIQLARELFTESVEAPFLAKLAQAKSNLPEYGDGAALYERWVRPAAVDLSDLAAHYAVSSLFESFPDQCRIHAYSVDRRDFRSSRTGKARLVVGRAQFTSEITSETGLLSFGALHLGDHNASAGVRQFESSEEFEKLVKDAEREFERADFTEVIRVLDRHFGDAGHSLRSLFRDAQRRILNLILESSREEANEAYQRLYEDRAPLLRYLASLSVPPPREFVATAEFVHNASLRAIFRSDEPDVERARTVLAAAKQDRVTLDQAGLALAAETCLERLTDRLRADPQDLELLQRVDDMVRLVRALPFHVKIWRVQNTYWHLLGEVAERDATEAGEPWVVKLKALGEPLSVRVPE